MQHVERQLQSIKQQKQSDAIHWFPMTEMYSELQLNFFFLPTRTLSIIRHQWFGDHSHAGIWCPIHSSSIFFFCPPLLSLRLRHGIWKSAHFPHYQRQLHDTFHGIFFFLSVLYSRLVSPHLSSDSKEISRRAATVFYPYPYFANCGRS